MDAVLTARRKPWVAGLLSVVVPGLGHIYCGHLAQGNILLVLFTLTYVACLALFVLVPLPAPHSVVVLSLIVLALWLYVIISAVRLARSEGGSYQPKGFNKWYVYLAVWVIVALIIQDGVREFVVKPYRMAAGSMAPTLLVGERIFVNQMAYGLQWPQDCQFRLSLPPMACYSSTLLVAFSQPLRGDVIVFPYPEDEDRDFIKRIVGLPGETVEVRDKVILVNGEPLDDGANRKWVDPHVFSRLDNPRDNFGPVTIPENSYFVMGDNRDRSLDSRFFGYVARKKIRGKAARIYWSRARDESLWGRVRWERIGKAIS